jgi:hypothetical protein
MYRSDTSQTVQVGRPGYKQPGNSGVSRANLIEGRLNGEERVQIALNETGENVDLDLTQA